jgi:hypothetical protein
LMVTQSLPIEGAGAWLAMHGGIDSQVPWARGQVPLGVDSGVYSGA